MKKYLILIIFACMIFACKDKADKFPITFLKSSVYFNKQGGNTTLISQSDEWNFGNCLKLNNQIINYPHCEEVFPNTEPPIQKIGICSNDVLTIKYDVIEKKIEPVNIESDWFKLTKKTAKEFNINITSNSSGKSREIRILVDSNGTEIIISQSGD